MIPLYDRNGNLPPGIHFAGWREVVERFGTNDHRRELLVGLRRALESLANAGCETVYIDGSFVTAKEAPADFDCCWEIDSVSLELLDETLKDFSNAQAAQKRKYGGELFPLLPMDLGEPTILDWFQLDKQTAEAKGVIALSLRSLHD